MSYILDALKKAEQERRRGRTPDFLDDHGLRPQEPKRRAWGYLLVIALVAVAGGFGWYYGHDKQSEIKLPFQTDRAQTAAASPASQQPIAAPSKPASTPVEHIVDTKTPAKVAPKPVEHIVDTKTPAKVAQKPVERATDKKEPAKVAPPKMVIKEQPAPQVKTEQTGTADAANPDPSKVYNITDLPDPVRTGLPAMSVSTHIYSSEPSERLVSVNGSIGREGKEIFKGITVDAITPEGVILKSQGYKFRVGLK
jgi:general secretion pathway protein B